jgi:hypothetical protein
MKPLLTLPRTEETREALLYEKGYYMPRNSPDKCTIFGEHCTYKNLDDFLEKSKTINPTIRAVVEEYLSSLIEESVFDVGSELD